MKGITFKQVKECLQQLTDNIPSTEEVCTEYMMNVIPAYHLDEKKGRPAADFPDIFVMMATVGKIKINLRVEGFILVSESDEQLAKGEYV